MIPHTHHGWQPNWFGLFAIFGACMLMFVISLVWEWRDRRKKRQRPVELPKARTVKIGPSLR